MKTEYKVNKKSLLLCLFVIPFSVLAFAHRQIECDLYTGCKYSQQRCWGEVLGQ